jgi:hypothetical protein
MYVFGQAGFSAHFPKVREVLQNTRVAYLSFPSYETSLCFTAFDLNFRLYF